MKVLVVLVLLFLTGCNGGHKEHPSQIQIQMVQDAYWDYVQKSTMTPKDYVLDIRHSSPGQYLCSLISQSVDIIYTFFRLVYAHIVIWTNNFYHKICHEVDHLHHHLDHFLYHLEADIHYHAKELADKISWKLEDIKQCAAHYVETLDPKGLKIALLEKTKELHEHLDQCFEHLHTHHHHHGDHHHHGGDDNHHGHPHHHHHHNHHHGHPHHDHKDHHHDHKDHHDHHHDHKDHHDHHHDHKCHHDHHHDRHHDHKDHHDHHHDHKDHHHDHKDHHDHHHDHKGHHDHHHDHKDHHDHHHDHKDHYDHKDHHELKKKVYESLEDFKVTLFALVYRFDVKLTHTTYDMNKKIVPRRRRRRGKLNKGSDHLEKDLGHLWEEWAQSQKKAD